MKAGSIFAVAGWAAVAAAAWLGYRNLIADDRERRVDQEPMSPPPPDPLDVVLASVAALVRVPLAGGDSTDPAPHLRQLSGLHPRPPGTSPKARHDDYAPAPFYFEQHNPIGGCRLVAWTGDLDAQREALATLVHLLAPRVEVLTKVMREDDSEATLPDDWVRYYGIAPAPALLEAMGRCEAFIFRDSRTQICARNPWTMEYVVLDHRRLPLRLLGRFRVPRLPGRARLRGRASNR